MPAGRPTKYKPEYCQEMLDFFDVDPYIEKTIPHYKNGELAWEDTKLVPNRIPSIRKFAKHIGVDFTTIYEWVDKHPEFSYAFTQAQEIRKDMLIDMGMTGVSPPASFKFVAVNLTDMRDKIETKHEAGDDMKDLIGWLGNRDGK